jgi:hypothetical protein
MIDGIEKNPKLGYYRVGNEVFYSKPHAYIYASQTKQPIEWRFNDVEFAKFNWAEEPAANLREIYRQRALQLREKYDYIRLEASGGGDSTTAAFSFLLNGIHLDEIIFRHPVLGEEGAVDEPWNTKPTNALSEWRFAAQPLLKWIKTNFPKTVVRMHDYSENMLESQDKIDESRVFRSRDWFQPGYADQFDNFNVKEHRELYDTGKKICILAGIDKPKLTVLNDKWYVYFSDLQANWANPLVKDYTNITNEYFYWTPDMPEIVCKQAHMIKQWFDLPQNQNYRHLVTSPQGNANMRTTYENIAKSIIYPDYDLNTWQADKSTKSFYCELDHWFYVNFKDTKFSQVWQAGLQLLIDKIDPKYLQYELGTPVGLTSNISQLYCLGPSEFTKNIAAFVNRDYLGPAIYKTRTIDNKKIVMTTTTRSVTSS